MNPRTKKIIIVCGVAFVIVMSWLTINSLTPKAYLHFQVAPQQAALTIDSKGKQVVNNGDTIQVTPGKHSVAVFRDEFNPYFTDVNVANGQTVEIIAGLIGLTNNANKMLNNDASSKVFEAQTAQELGAQTTILEKLYPIMAFLPIENRNYTINSCPSRRYLYDPFKIALCITVANDSMKVYAKQNIQDLGYDPSSFEYIWTALWPN